MKTIEGFLTAGNNRFCIIVARFNEFITSKLLSGALDELRRHGVSEDNVDVVWVPGSFEIPLVAQKCARTKRYDAIITLGAASIGGCGNCNPSDQNDHAVNRKGRISLDPF